MNRNNLPLIGVVLFLVVGLGLTALLLFNKSGGTPAPNPNEAPPPPPATTVYIARQDIPPRTILTKTMFQEETTNKIAPGAITDKNLVFGKLAAETIHQGDTVTKDMTIDPLRRVVAANIQIPKPDLRAVGVWVDPLQTAAGLVDKGDRVDVIAAHKLKVKGADGDTFDMYSGRTIAQDLEVLAVDRSVNAPAPAPTPVPGAAPTQPPPPTPPPPPTQPGQKTYTRLVLAAPPDIAERLVAANLMGELHITIRDGRVRDNLRIAEAFEYPARIVDPLTRKRMETAIQEESDMRKAENTARLDMMKESQKASLNKPVIPSPGTVPANVDAFPTPVPTVETREITVVRGTEKTRVLVPR